MAKLEDFKRKQSEQQKDLAQQEQLFRQNLMKEESLSRDSLEQQSLEANQQIVRADIKRDASKFFDHINNMRLAEKN